MDFDKDLDKDLQEYRVAVGGDGPHAYNWKDKPHRLVYDLIQMVQEERNHRAALRPLYEERVKAEATKLTDLVNDTNLLLEQARAEERSRIIGLLNAAAGKCPCSGEQSCEACLRSVRLLVDVIAGEQAE